LDNGPASRHRISERIAKAGHEWGDPFEISVLRRDDYAVNMDNNCISFLFRSRSLSRLLIRDSLINLFLKKIKINNIQTGVGCRSSFIESRCNSI